MATTMGLKGGVVAETVMVVNQNHLQFLLQDIIPLR